MRINAILRRQGWTVDCALGTIDSEANALHQQNGPVREVRNNRIEAPFRWQRSNFNE